MICDNHFGLPKDDQLERGPCTFQTKRANILNIPCASRIFVSCPVSRAVMCNKMQQTLIHFWNQILLQPCSFRKLCKLLHCIYLVRDLRNSQQCFACTLAGTIIMGVGGIERKPRDTPGQVNWPEGIFHRLYQRPFSSQYTPNPRCTGYNSPYTSLFTFCINQSINQPINQSESMMNYTLHKQLKCLSYV